MPTPADAAAAAWVIDTNIVLDLFVFDAPCAGALRTELQAARRRWCATAAMREELARVLRYPAIAAWLTRTGRSAEAVIAQFDAHATLMDEAPAAQPRCSDPDDQKFIDLAVQQRALLLSRDKAVLRLKKRLAPLGVRVAQGIAVTL
ncbi:PIN domain-containing protein [Comamonas badia]|uniref:PIN domain-containing protein n=1 Tax=Comamonas badia TaxID=265291 RepID=UPI0004A3B732|nr:PIN domain-containing protein [Comamonas badia]